MKFKNSITIYINNNFNNTYLPKQKLFSNQREENKAMVWDVTSKLGQGCGSHKFLGKRHAIGLGYLDKVWVWGPYLLKANMLDDNETVSIIDILLIVSCSVLFHLIS